MKNGLKKLIIALLIIPVMMFFPACGGDDESNNSSPGTIPSDSTFTVHFYTGTEDTFNIASQTIAYRGLVRRPDDPTRVGYVFIGWYKDATCTEIWTFEVDLVVSDMTLYARWQKREY